MTPRPVSPDPGQLDRDRRHALQELISLLTAVVAEAQVLTTAALRSDLRSLAAASARLAEMGTDPAFDLGGVDDVYRGLRQLIVERQPGRLAPAPDARAVVVRSP